MEPNCQMSHGQRRLWGFPRVYRQHDGRKNCSVSIDRSPLINRLSLPDYVKAKFIHCLQLGTKFPNHKYTTCAPALTDILVLRRRKDRRPSVWNVLAPPKRITWYQMVSGFVSLPFLVMP